MFAPIPFDEPAALEWGRVMAMLREAGRRAPLLDTQIAATAIVQDALLVTQDADYGAIAEAVTGLRVARL